MNVDRAAKELAKKAGMKKRRRKRGIITRKKVCRSQPLYHGGKPDVLTGNYRPTLLWISQKRSHSR